MTASWAAPLNTEERRKLARMLEQACSSFFQATLVDGKGRQSLNTFTSLSAEMASLHLDVTQRPLSGSYALMVGQGDTDPGPGRADGC